MKIFLVINASSVIILTLMYIIDWMPPFKYVAFYFVCEFIFYFAYRQFMDLEKQDDVTDRSLE